MNKTTTMAVLASAATALSCSAAAPATAQDYRAIANQMIAAMPDLGKAKAIASSNCFWTVGRRKDLKDARLAMDHDLAAAGFKARPLCNLRWPEVSAAARAENGTATVMPVRVSLCAKYGAEMRYTRGLEKNGATLDEVVSLIDEANRAFITHPVGMIGRKVLDEDMKCLQAVALRHVKKMLRKQGKSFVVKDGVNPCGELMEGLNTALNAPRLAGLNEWLASGGASARVDTSSLPPAETVTALRAAILDGSRDFDEKSPDGRILRVCLGTAGYNAFVKEYNGD